MNKSQLLTEFNTILEGHLTYKKNGFIDEVDCFALANQLLLDIDDKVVYSMVTRDPSLGIINWEWLLECSGQGDLVRASDIVRQNLLVYLLSKVRLITKELEEGD